MTADQIFEDAALEALRRKYFPRVPWTEKGPVRRRYRARAAAPGQTVTGALAALAAAEGFTGPGRRAVAGGAAECLAAYRDMGGDASAGMVFGEGLDACWCDIAAGTPDEEGWQEILVRSERAENLIALAHAVGALRFKRAVG